MTERDTGELLAAQAAFLLFTLTVGAVGDLPEIVSMRTGYEVTLESYQVNCQLRPSNDLTEMVEMLRAWRDVLPGGRICVSALGDAELSWGLEAHGEVAGVGVTAWNVLASKHLPAPLVKQLRADIGDEFAAGYLLEQWVDLHPTEAPV